MIIIIQWSRGLTCTHHQQQEKKNKVDEGRGMGQNKWPSLIAGRMKRFPECRARCKTASRARGGVVCQFNRNLRLELPASTPRQLQLTETFIESHKKWEGIVDWMTTTDSQNDLRLRAVQIKIIIMKNFNRQFPWSPWLKAPRTGATRTLTWIAHIQSHTYINTVTTTLCEALCQLLYNFK